MVKALVPFDVHDGYAFKLDISENNFDVAKDPDAYLCSLLDEVPDRSSDHANNSNYTPSVQESEIVL